MVSPIFSLRDRNLSLSVFEFKNQDGTKNLSVNIQRSYKKGEDWIREEIHCYDDDLLKLSNICVSAYNKMLALKQTKQTPAPTPTQAPAQVQSVEPVQSQPVDDEIPFDVSRSQ